MTIAQEFLKKLQDATGNETLPEKFCASHTGIPAFKDVLYEYAEYYKKLTTKQKESLSTIFWQLIKETGTPIIENNPQKNDEANVYFLFPEADLKNSNDLYLRGEFHGLYGVNERNKLDKLQDTGIMYRINSIPLDAMITYQYQQAGAANLNDANSSHRNLYHGHSDSIILRVNPDREQSHLGKREEKNYWDRIISSESTNSSKRFNYHTTLYSDLTNKLHTCDVPLPQKVDTYYDPVPTNPDEIKATPYADFTRAVHIFKPASNKIENVIIFNDGRSYILAGIMDHLEKMDSRKLSPNTAFVFITPLQGLVKTMPGIENDPGFKMAGMGVRIIDYDKGIKNYITFLEKLFPQLSEKDINIPNDPRRRVMVGASLSGTASIYIALERPGLFNGIIAQSPTPSNDGILRGVQANPQANIQLSCGLFEQPRYHGADTDFFKYAKTLADRLSLQLDKGLHGHNPAAWVEDLDRSLPALSAVHSHTLDAQELKKSAERPSSQSIFSKSKKPSEEGDTKIWVHRIKGG